MPSLLQQYIHSLHVHSVRVFIKLNFSTSLIINHIQTIQFASKFYRIYLCDVKYLSTINHIRYIARYCLRNVYYMFLFSFTRSAGLTLLNKLLLIAKQCTVDVCNTYTNIFCIYRLRVYVIYSVGALVRVV